VLQQEAARVDCENHGQDAGPAEKREAEAFSGEQGLVRISGEAGASRSPRPARFRTRSSLPGR
jgi:hypothetical protein